MQYTTLNNNVIMPMLGYGTWDMLGDQAYRCVSQALEVGYRLIDGAQMYNNESELGKAIETSALPRQDLFLTTKLQSAKDVRGAIHRSQDQLRTDYLDLLLIHWPMGKKEDIEIWRIMEEFYDQGIVRALGLSNFYDDDYQRILDQCRIRPQVIQQEIHVLCQRKELRKQYTKDQIQLEAWSPLADARHEIMSNQILLGIGAKYGKTPAQVMLRFIIECSVVAIPKSRDINRMRENFDIFDFSLDKEDMFRIETLDLGKTIFGWYK